MTYIPQVNDYVVWTKGVEGWVYFKDREYITIEYVVRPKDEVNFECCPIHRNERLLVICYNNQWEELQYIKSRQSIYEETENCLAIASEVPG
jgi:hypothetical protein